MSVGTTQTNETTPPRGKKPASAAPRIVTYVEIARDLAKLEDRQATQRAELAATDQLIAEKQKALAASVSGIGRKK
jgi:hypothetical protein